MSGNYPGDVDHRHAHFNPPVERACSECGEADQSAGCYCDNCGEYVWTDEELDEAAAEDAADRAAEMEAEARYGL